MTLDQDIWSFAEDAANCSLINTRLNSFWSMFSSILTSNENNYTVVKRGGEWSIEGVTVYNGLFQDFGDISGSINMNLNSTTSRSGIKATLVGECLINGFGDNLLTGYPYTFFIKQDSIGGKKFRWPNLTSVLGEIDETPNAITVCLLVKLPNGKLFAKNDAFVSNDNVGYYEFRVTDDILECNKTEISVGGNVLLNDFGGNLSVSKVNGLSGNVGVAVAGTNGGLFTIDSDGSFVFDLNSEFEYVEPGVNVTTSVTHTVYNLQEELTATLSVVVNAEWNMLSDVNVLHWVEASDPSNYTLVGSKVSGAKDLSENGYDLVQSNDSYRPTLVSSALNGMDVFSFDGGDYLEHMAGTWFTERNHCIFYVVKGNNTIPACGMVDGGTCLYNNNAGAISYAGYGSGKGEAIGSNGIAAHQHRASVISNLMYRSQTLTDYNIVAFKWEVRKPTGFLNGIPFEIGLTTSQVCQFYLNFGLGAYGSFTGFVAERIITDEIPSQENFDKIVGKLAHKWGLTSKLQFNHPYKNFQPGQRIFELYPDISYAPITATRSGNVLTNDKGAISVTKVNGSSSNLGVPVAGTNGGLFTVNADGTWSFSTNSNFDGLTGTQFLNTVVNYTATDGVSELSTTLTVRVLANYYTELDYDGGGWTLLTDEHILAGSVQTYSFDPATREFSQQATTRGTGSSIHYGCNVLLGINKPFTQVRVYHTGGSGYSCAQVTWNNFIYGGNEDITPDAGNYYYPGWYVFGCDLIKNTVLVDGWNTRTLLYPGTRISLGLGGYSGCTRVVMKNIVLVR